MQTMILAVISSSWKVTGSSGDQLSGDEAKISDLPSPKGFIEPDPALRAQDFVSGMTDQYAIAAADLLEPGIGSEITKPHMPTE